jgi:hypothetical protein
MLFARFTIHHNFEVERQFAGRVAVCTAGILLLTRQMETGFVVVSSANVLFSPFIYS